MAERPSGRFLVTWHVLGLATVLFVPAYLQFGEPPWALPSSQAHVVAGLSGCYLAGAVLAAVRPWGRLGTVLGQGLGPPGLLLLAPAVLSVLYLALLLLDRPYSRSLLVLGSACVLLMVPVPGLLRRTGKPRASLLLAAAGAAALALAAVLPSMEEPSAADERTPTVSSRALETLYGSIEARLFEHHLPPSPVHPGAVDRVGETYLTVTGDGAFFLLMLDHEAGTLRVDTLPFRAPLNGEAFDRDVPADVDRSRFRVADLLVLPTDSGTRVLVSHHVWYPDRRCVGFRVSAAEFSRGALRAGPSPPGWRTVYETRPCVSLNFEERGHPFAGHQSGGRMEVLDDGLLLLTVGDHEFDGWNRTPALPQDTAADYGKTLVVDPRSGTAEVFTLGHRNHQGLAVGPRGRIWSTEHGPEGGDELNLLVRNGNYGWPLSTLGTEYGDVKWPLQVDAEAAGRFRPPVHAWVPSIGISNLLVLREGPLPTWKGDLLVGSLRARTLYRLRLQGNRVAYAEPIQVGRPIRDLVEGPEGRLLLLLNDGAVMSLGPPGAAAEGEALFGRCAACHTPDVGGIGPPLDGVYGRRIAGLSTFDYSEALRSIKGRWTEERLHAYLMAPDSFAPGTTMRFDGIPDSTRRAALIEYLKRR